MTIIDSIAERLGYTRKAEGYRPPDVLRATAEAEQFSLAPNGLGANQARIFERLSWIYSAVSVVAGMSATVALNVKKIRGERLMDVPNHPFETLLRRPNPMQSRYEFLYATAAYRLLTGNAYWYVNKESENAEPDELWVIPSYKITPIPDGNSYIRGYKYEPGGLARPMELEPWQVVHFKDFHPNNTFQGLSRVEPIAVTAAADIQMQKWNAKFFGQNNARLPGILTFADQVNDTDWEVIKKDVDESAAKRQFILLRGTGTGAVAWLQATNTIKDMEFLSGRTFNKEEIFNVFAPGLSSVLAVNATEANARTGKSTLIEFAVYPSLVSIAERITADVLPAYAAQNKQITYVAEFDDIRVTDRVVTLQEMAEYSKTHTIDEIRDYYYSDGPLATETNEKDDRGWMLPAQVGPQTPVPSKEEPMEPDQEEPGQEEPEPEEDEMQDPEAEPEPDQEEEPGEEPSAPDQNPEGLIQSLDQEPESADTMRADLIKWRNKAANRLKNKRNPAVKFNSQAIPPTMMAAIMGSLETADSLADINQVFHNAMVWGTYP